MHGQLLVAFRLWFLEEEILRKEKKFSNLCGKFECGALEIRKISGPQTGGGRVAKRVMVAVTKLYGEVLLFVPDVM